MLSMCRALLGLHDILCFVPGHNVGQSNVVEAGEEGKGGKDDWGNEKLPLVEGLENRWLLEFPLSVHALNSIRLMAIIADLLGLLLVVGLRLALQGIGLGRRDIAPPQGIAYVCARGNSSFGRGHVGSGQRWKRSELSRVKDRVLRRMVPGGLK